MFEKIKIGTEKEENKIKEAVPHTWTEDQLAPLIGNMMLLKDTANLKKNPEEYEKRARETFQEIHELITDNGGHYSEDVSDIYHDYSNIDPVIVRREDPIRLSRLINGEDLEIRFDPNVAYETGEKYANSAMWPYGPEHKTSGIANAFLEGRGNAGPIVMLGGYNPHGKSMEIVEPEVKEETVGTLERHSVRILSGKITKDDLEFIIVRMPAKFFDRSKMTPKEIERLEKGSLEQIFRGYRF